MLHWHQNRHAATVEDHGKPPKEAYHTSRQMVPKKAAPYRGKRIAGTPTELCHAHWGVQLSNRNFHARTSQLGDHDAVQV